MLGAPNVMRGKSHMGWVNASDMIARGLCSILASDYYYPAPLIAAFRLARRRRCAARYARGPLISGSPASAVGLSDRGCIAQGMRADLILVDATRAKPTGGGRRIGRRTDRASHEAERILG